MAMSYVQSLAYPSLPFSQFPKDSLNQNCVYFSSILQEEGYFLFCFSSENDNGTRSDIQLLIDSFLLSAVPGGAAPHYRHHQRLDH